MAIDHHDGYRPDEDDHREDGEQEGFFETLDRVTDGGWKVVLAAIAIALPLACLGIWVWETYVVVPLP